jgi:hypothetical protein
MEYNNSPNSTWKRNSLAGVPLIKRIFLALQIFNSLATAMHLIWSFLKEVCLDIFDISMITGTQGAWISNINFYQTNHSRRRLPSVVRRKTAIRSNHNFKKYLQAWDVAMTHMGLILPLMEHGCLSARVLVPSIPPSNLIVVLSAQM